MRFERGKSPKEAMRIGKYSAVIDIEKGYEEADDGRLIRNSPSVIEVRLKRIEEGILRDMDDRCWFTANPIDTGGGDMVEEEYELGELRGKIVSYNGKLYNIP